MWKWKGKQWGWDIWKNLKETWHTLMQTYNHPNRRHWYKGHDDSGVKNSAMQKHMTRLRLVTAQRKQGNWDEASALLAGPRQWEVVGSCWGRTAINSHGNMCYITDWPSKECPLASLLWANQLLFDRNWGLLPTRTLHLCCTPGQNQNQWPGRSQAPVWQLQLFVTSWCAHQSAF